MASNDLFLSANPPSPLPGPLQTPSITVTPPPEGPRPRVRPGLPPIKSGGINNQLYSLSPRTAIPATGMTDGGVSYTGTARSMEDVLGQLVDTLTTRLPLPQPTMKEKLDKSLPPYLENVLNGLINTYAAASVVTALFAGVEANLLTGNDPPSPSVGGFRNGVGIQRLYLFLTYAALALNLGATVSSLFLIKFFGRLSTQMTDREAPEDTPRTIRRLLMHYLPQRGSGAAWAYPAVEMHWYLSFYLGSTCVFCQLFCYIWLHEANLMAGLLTPIMLVTVLPFFFNLFLL